MLHLKGFPYPGSCKKKLCIAILDATSDGRPQTNVHNSLPHQFASPCTGDKSEV
jgi:hypothetical protein